MEKDEKIFESRNAYITIKITLNEPINPVIDPQVLPRSADIAKKAISNMPQTFPNVTDAV